MKKIAAIILSAAFILSSLAASGGASGPLFIDGSAFTGSAVTYRTIADFEDFDDLYNLNMSLSLSSTQTLGRFSWNKNKAFVTQGAASLRWDVEGAAANAWNALTIDMDIPMYGFYYLFNNTLTAKRGEPDFTDWTNVVSAHFDVYNANDFEATVAFHLRTLMNYTYCFSAATLRPHGWTTVTMHVSPWQFADVIGDPVTQLAFAVKYDYEIDADGSLYYPPGTFYMDNFYAVLDNSAAAVDKKFESPREILNFDSLSDMKYVRQTMGHDPKNMDREIWSPAWYNFMGGGGGVGYNSDPRYVAEGRNGSLEFRLDQTVLTRMYLNQSITQASSQAGFAVITELLKAVNFGGMYSAGFRIAVDVYNASGFDKELFFGIYDNDGLVYESKKEFPWLWGEKGVKDKCFKLADGQFTTIYLDDFSHVDLSKGIWSIRFSSSLMDVERTARFYFNNLRIERGQA